MKGFRQLAMAFSLVAYCAATCSSCPVCNQPIGEQVRAGIFDEDFAFNLLAATLPFGVFLGITAVILFGFPRGKASSPSPSSLSARARSHKHGP